MVATNRLTGHSKGFFSVYTLPPNQATTPQRQMVINARYSNSLEEYRNVKEIIKRKSKSLLAEIPKGQIGMGGIFLNNDAAYTPEISDSSVTLIVTSPPFLNTVQYEKDNWMRLWFNHLETNEMRGFIHTSSIKTWEAKMRLVFMEFSRIMQNGAYAAFEVGEVKKGKINLDEVISRIVIECGFSLEAALINTQSFTKTSNIWGVSNNSSGTNTNRIVLFRQGLSG
jgi:hypothetical protein